MKGKGRKGKERKARNKEVRKKRSKEKKKGKKRNIKLSQIKSNYMLYMIAADFPAGDCFLFFVSPLALPLEAGVP